jgi:hypothetical protein
LGLRRFAEKNGISIKRLRHWVYGKRKSKSVKPDEAAPVFEEIKLTGGLPLQSWVAEVSLPSGLIGSPRHPSKYAKSKRKIRRNP